MGDKGILVEGLFAARDVHVNNTPTVLRYMKKISADKVINDRRIASKRVHVQAYISRSTNMIQRTMANSLFWMYRVSGILTNAHILLLTLSRASHLLSSLTDYDPLPTPDAITLRDPHPAGFRRQLFPPIFHVTAEELVNIREEAKCNNNALVVNDL
ncbi:unnamed protein product [Lepeophtheirus salmonis]|uniref:(salmon louse) hypothetical protein n=1 Tax=Lepeophtheirus salmonis TaxID=72036 RepID=A0A7R8CR45_LEPSM|nr:unnamed protein product [Lepeophtheirus salmonis]CAF2901791.1 unnamed protein product [Lepeophtheirus salmonis]